MITPEFPLPCSTSFVFYKILFTFYSITLLSFILSQMSVSCLLITLQLEYKFHTDRSLFSLSSKSQEPRTVHSTSRHAIMKPRDVFFHFPLQFHQFFFMYFKALLFGVCTLRVVMSSWWMDTFFHYVLSLFIPSHFPHLKSLSDIKTLVPALFYWYLHSIYFLPFYF